MAEYREADLVECLQTTQGTYKSCLHLIAGMADKELATKLCRELLEKVTNAKNKQCLLNVRTVDEFGMDGKSAQVAAIHIAAYNDNSGVVTLLCKEYGFDANSETIGKLKKDIKPLELVTSKEVANNNKVDVNLGRHVGAGKKVLPVCIFVVVMVIVSALIAVTVLLVHKGDANASRYADSPLHAAAYICNTDTVKQLLDDGADVNAMEQTDGTTPLYIAAQQGCLEVVKLLIDNKADVNAGRQSDGDTPLHVAAYNGYTEVVKQLLDSNANVNVRKHSDGATTLLIAAQERRTEIVQLLLDHDADVNTSEWTDGDTPLHASAWNGSTEIVRMLLNSKADVNARKLTDGATPLYLASLRGHEDIVQLLLANKATM